MSNLLISSILCPSSLQALGLDGSTEHVHTHVEYYSTYLIREPGHMNIPNTPNTVLLAALIFPCSPHLSSLSSPLPFRKITYFSWHFTISLWFHRSLDDINLPPATSYSDMPGQGISIDYNLHALNWKRKHKLLWLYFCALIWIYTAKIHALHKKLYAFTN